MVIMVQKPLEDKYDLPVFVNPMRPYQSIAHSGKDAFSRAIEAKTENIV